MDEDLPLPIYQNERDPRLGEHGAQLEAQPIQRGGRVEGRSFARRLKEARRRRGWTQRELTEHAGVSLSQVQSVEQGRRRAARESARWLASALDAK
jgi:ribosome-binding protein aMBF1 (putative translation factor)